MRIDLGCRDIQRIESVAAGVAFASGAASETTTVLFASDAGGCPKADVVKNATDANATEALMTAQRTDLRTLSEAPRAGSIMMAEIEKADEAWRTCLVTANHISPDPGRQVPA
jgi:hypothetical protein